MGLRDLRRRRGLTQTELADRSGVKQTTISQIELQDDPNPSWFTIRALKRALSAAPEDFLRDTPPRHRREASA
jgi:transcriptional regulator with XRE-family HTH domain